MENLQIPDLAAAAQHLTNAKASLEEAVRALRGADGTQVLSELAQNFGVMAGKFREGMLLAGLKVNLVDKNTAARALGAVMTEKKRAGLVVSREKLAKKRRLATDPKTVRERASGDSIGLK